MSDINSIVDQVSQVLTSASAIVDNMKDGQKIKLSELADKVGNEVGLDGDEILPFVTFLAHHIDNVEIARGRNGGLYKGTKPAPAVKPVKAPKVNTKAVPAVAIATAPVAAPVVSSVTDSASEDSDESEEIISENVEEDLLA